MPANDSYMKSHPDELLEAFALDALDEEEAGRVESHLDLCPQCRRSVAQLYEVAAQLGRSVESREPSQDLRSHLMDALAQDGPPAVPSGEANAPTGYLPRAVRLALPIAAAVTVALFTLAVLMNLRISGRVDGLERENSTLTASVGIMSGENATLTARLAQSAEQDSQMADALRQLQITSYWLANPVNRSMTLNPPGGAGDSRGVILVGDGGQRAVLMVAGLAGPSRTSTYEVWLIRHGARIWAGRVKVDDKGWGTVTLQPQESLFRFDQVQLTMEAGAGAAPESDDLVLVGAIPSSKPLEMLTLSSDMLKLRQWP